MLVTLPVPVAELVTSPLMVDAVHVIVVTVPPEEFVVVRSNDVPGLLVTVIGPLYSLPWPAWQAGPVPAVEQTFALPAAEGTVIPVIAIPRATVASKCELMCLMGFLLAFCLREPIPGFTNMLLSIKQSHLSFSWWVGTRRSLPAE
jgi:hypothetical protein